MTKNIGVLRQYSALLSEMQFEFSAVRSRGKRTTNQAPPQEVCKMREENCANTRTRPGGVYMRETGTICQIGVSAAERSIFGAKQGHFRRFRTTKLAML